MDMVSFLHSLEKNTISFQGKILVFRVKKQYPHLFFSFLLDFIKKKQGLSSLVLDLERIRLEEAMVKVSMVPFGGSLLYWTTYLGVGGHKKSESFLRLLTHYMGVNTVMLNVSHAMLIPKGTTHINYIEVEETCDRKLFDLLMSYFTPGIEKMERNKLIKLVFQGAAVSIEEGCSFLRYVDILGCNVSLLSMILAENASVSHSSLFFLSRYFFAKEAKNFFTLWFFLCKRYSPLFWITFWSDQMWYAFHYAYFRQREDLKQAKMVSFRLPFSFLQKDWSNYVSKELIVAHQFISSIDFHLKNGGHSFSLDLFLSKFLWGEFLHDELVE